MAKIRKCNQCGVEYDGTRGFGGSYVHEGDLEKFPYNEITGIGVSITNPGWMHGAFCSDACYKEAYYEPPAPW